MGQSIILLIGFGIVLLIFGVYLLYDKNKGKAKPSSTRTSTNSGKSTQETTQMGVKKPAKQVEQHDMSGFIKFDKIANDMIYQNKGERYTMVIQCKGINYNLMSEIEQMAIEEGFIMFLNTLKFPIQLYVQTRSLNLKDIIDGYKDKVRELRTDVEQIQAKMREARAKGNTNLFEKLRYEERRKMNVLEYGADISEYIGRMSLNKNVLQQKTYVIVSYYANENGSLSNYSKEEIDDMCFQELFTRSQSVMRSLAASEVTGKILNSEELAELLYIAYNRDDSELLQLSKALDAQYDALYNTAKDVLQKKQERLEEEIALEAVDLATESIMLADQKREQEMKDKAKRREKVKEKALELVEEYRAQMDDDLYERVKKEVKGEDSRKTVETENVEEEEAPKKRRGRKKKTEESEDTKVS